MIRRIPQAGTEIMFSDLLSGFKGIFANEAENFIKALSGYLPSRYVFLVNSGTTAFYIILKALKGLSPKKEVILPAYTAPAVVLSVLKANLKVVLCDISITDFNMDLNLLPRVITEETLCVVPSHMFGIAIGNIETLKQRIPNIFIVEDCAQSLGSKIGEKNTGSFSDVSFLSFNRGKNIPTYGGGCIFTRSKEIAEKIEIEINELKRQPIFFKLTIPFKLMVLSLIVRPFIYGLFYPIISQFKDNQVPIGFSVRRYTNFQAGIGLSLLERIDEFSKERYENGIKLINGLADIKDIITPTISNKIKPAFNRLPVVFKDLKRREIVEKALKKAGFDISRMYLRPLHHIFDLGYKYEEFPNATYVAERLLTLPVHSLVEEELITKMIELIRKAMV